MTVQRMKRNLPIQGCFVPVTIMRWLLMIIVMIQLSNRNRCTHDNDYIASLNITVITIIKQLSSTKSLFQQKPIWLSHKVKSCSQHGAQVMCNECLSWTVVSGFRTYNHYEEVATLLPLPCLDHSWRPFHRWRTQGTGRRYSCWQARSQRHPHLRTLPHKQWARYFNLNQCTMCSTQSGNMHIFRLCNSISETQIRDCASNLKSTAWSQDCVQSENTKLILAAWAQDAKDWLQWNPSNMGRPWPIMLA